MPNKDKFKRNATWRKWYYKHRKEHIESCRLRALAKYHNPVKKVCSVGGCNEIGGRHHPDYSKPKEIVWLCTKHHEKLHHKTYRKCEITTCENKHFTGGLCKKHYSRKCRGTLGRYAYARTIGVVVKTHQS